MPANLNSARFCPVLGRWKRLRAPWMLRKFLLPQVLGSPLRTLPVQTLTPRIHHHEGSCQHWVPTLWPLMLMNTRLSLLTLSTGESTESGSAVQDRAFLSHLFHSLHYRPPPRSACINAPFLTYTRNHHFFIVSFYSCTECFHKGSRLGWIEVLNLPGQLNEPFSEVSAIRWALPGPGASSSTRHVTVPCVCIPQSGPLLTDRKLPKGELSLAPAPTWFLLPYPSLSQLLYVQRECVSRSLGLPRLVWQRTPEPGGAALSYSRVPTEPDWMVLWLHRGQPPA